MTVRGCNDNHADPRGDFVYPPECQREPAEGVPNARVLSIDRAGHNSHEERTAEVMAAVRAFIPAEAPVVAAAGGRT